MAGLQRSAISFRRQGSSGSVWDDKFLSELEFASQQEQQKQREQQQQQEQPDENLKQGSSTEAESLDTPTTAKQEKSGGAGDQLSLDAARRTPARGYRTVKVAEVEEPPSPKVPACGFCGVFAKSPAKKPS